MKILQRIHFSGLMTTMLVANSKKLASKYAKVGNLNGNILPYYKWK